MTHISHPDRHMLRIISDEADVQFSVKLLEDDWNTFDPLEIDYVGISIGTLAPPDVASTFLMARKMALKHTRNSSETGL